MKIAREEIKKLLLTASFVAVGSFLAGCSDSNKAPDSRPAAGLATESDEASTAGDAALAAADAVASASVDPAAATTPAAQTVFQSVKDIVAVIRDEVRPAIAQGTAKVKSHNKYLSYFDFSAADGADPATFNSLTVATKNFERIMAEQAGVLTSLGSQITKISSMAEQLESKIAALQAADPLNTGDLNTLKGRLTAVRRAESDLAKLIREIKELNGGVKGRVAEYAETLTARKEVLLSRDTINSFVGEMGLTDGDMVVEEGRRAILDLPLSDRSALVSDLLSYMTTNLNTFKQAQLPVVINDIYTQVKLRLKLTLAKSDALKSEHGLDIKMYSDYLDALRANPALSDELSADRLETIIKERISDGLLRFEPTSFYFLDQTELSELPGDANANLRSFFSNASVALKDISSSVSLRAARTSATGMVDVRHLAVNGLTGQSIDLVAPLFVQLKGSVDSAKATEATTGSVAYRLGNTVIGAMQAYANSGEGFGLDGRQLETSVIASQSFGNYFAEAQIGSVSAADVHHADWSGVRSLFTVGYDAAFVSPFVQLSHRQLNRDSVVSLNDTAAFVGLDADIAGLAADTYSLNTRLLAKVGYGTYDWNADSRHLSNTGSVRGSVEWSASLNLNSGVTFSTKLGLDTLAGSSAAFNVSLDR